MNGNLELKFDKYTYEYTVTVEDDINNLEFEYILEDDTYVNIRNNNLINEENIVYLDVYTVDTEYTYTFYVYKESVNTVSAIDSYVESLSVSKQEEVSLYKVQILTISIFLIILILYSIMFRRKSKNK